MSNEHVEHNGSGYLDTTVDAAIKKEWNARDIAKEDHKYIKMKEHIKAILDDNGYVLDGPISLISSESGRKRRIY